MLQLTQNAASHLEDARQQQGLPDGYGIRVSGAPTPEGQVALQVGFAQDAADGDQVAEQHGTRLFVAPEVAEPLADAEIDIEAETPQGPQLVLRQKGDEAG